MKTPIILLLLLAGCSSVPEPLPFAMSYQGRVYGAVPLPLESLHVGDLVVYQAFAGRTVGRIRSVRSLGVYRLDGPDFALLTSSNYLARLVPTQ